MKLNKISNNIKALRFHNSTMSQQELADRVDCTRQTIISIEQNKYNPSLLLAMKIALTFNVGIDKVFDFEFQKKIK